MKQTLDYLRDRYFEEQSRFDHFENKCSKFLSFVTAVLAGITALGGMNKLAIFHVESELDWIILVFFLIGSFSAICAWGHSLLALKIGECAVMPKSKETAEYLAASEEEGKASDHIFNCYTDTLSKLSMDIDKKSKNLELAYEEIGISAACLVIAAIFTLGTEILK